MGDYLDDFASDGSVSPKSRRSRSRSYSRSNSSHSSYSRSSLSSGFRSTSSRSRSRSPENQHDSRVLSQISLSNNQNSLNIKNDHNTSNEKSHRSSPHEVTSKGEENRGTKGLTSAAKTTTEVEKGGKIKQINGSSKVTEGVVAATTTSKNNNVKDVKLPSLKSNRVVKGAKDIDKKASNQNENSDLDVASSMAQLREANDRMKHKLHEMTSAIATKSEHKSKLQLQRRHQEHMREKATSRLSHSGVRSPSGASNAGIFTAGMERIAHLTNEVADLKRINNDLMAENKTLVRLQYRQDKALTKYENEDADLPRIMRQYQEDLRSMREQLRLSQAKTNAANREVKAAHAENVAIRGKVEKMHQLLNSKNMPDREVLQKKLDEAIEDSSKKTERIEELSRANELGNKGQRRAENELRVKFKKTSEELEKMKAVNFDLSASVKRLETDLNKSKYRRLEGVSPKKPPSKSISVQVDTPLASLESTKKATQKYEKIKKKECAHKEIIQVSNEDVEDTPVEHSREDAKEDKKMAQITPLSKVAGEVIEAEHVKSRTPKSESPVPPPPLSPTKVLSDSDIDKECDRDQLPPPVQERLPEPTSFDSVSAPTVGQLTPPSKSRYTTEQEHVTLRTDFAHSEATNRLHAGKKATSLKMQVDPKKQDLLNKLADIDRKNAELEKEKNSMISERSLDSGTLDSLEKSTPVTKKTKAELLADMGFGGVTSNEKMQGGSRKDELDFDVPPKKIETKSKPSFLTDGFDYDVGRGEVEKQSDYINTSKNGAGRGSERNGSGSSFGRDIFSSNGSSDSPSKSKRNRSRPFNNSDGGSGSDNRMTPLDGDTSETFNNNGSSSNKKRHQRDLQRDNMSVGIGGLETPTTDPNPGMEKIKRSLPNFEDMMGDYKDADSGLFGNGNESGSGRRDHRGKGGGRRGQNEPTSLFNDDPFDLKSNTQNSPFKDFKHDAAPFGFVDDDLEETFAL